MYCSSKYIILCGVVTFNLADAYIVYQPCTMIHEVVFRVVSLSTYMHLLWTIGYWQSGSKIYIEHGIIVCKLICTYITMYLKPSKT